MRLPTEMTLAQIAAVMGGKVQGDANLKVSSVALSPLKATTGVEAIDRPVSWVRVPVGGGDAVTAKTPK